MVQARVPQVSTQQADGRWYLTPDTSLTVSQLSDASVLGRNVVVATDAATVRALLDVPSTAEAGGGSDCVCPDYVVVADATGAWSFPTTVPSGTAVVWCFGPTAPAATDLPGWASGPVRLRWLYEAR